jgi:hypothetical protein
MRQGLGVDNFFQGLPAPHGNLEEWKEGRTDGWMEE